MNVPTISTLPQECLRRVLGAFPPRLATLLFALLVLGLPQRALAHAAGWPSEGCSGCHSGGQIPSVSITSDLTTISPGQLVNLTVSVSATNGHGAGFYLESTVGKFSIVDSGTRLLGNGVTQNARRTGTGSVTTFQVGWTAPATPGGVDFNAWGNSVNGDGGSKGDAAGTAFLSVAYGCTGTTYYHDYDGDGVGLVSAGYTVACSLPQYYSARGDDCNDSEPANFPGNPEICDGKDNNCNAQVDEGLAINTYCTDADGDGHGAAGKASMTGCAPKKGFSQCDNDCNDSDVKVFPGNPEICDGKDNNCNGQVDEGLTINKYCTDADGDGHGVVGAGTAMGCAKPAGFGICDNDCNDNAANVYPGATELCDATDNNCNNQIDENAKILCGVGWCAREALGCYSICTPGDPRPEQCNDFDDDCDGVPDNGTDFELCGKHGFLCQAGYCVPGGGEAGAGGEAGTGGEAGMAGASGGDAPPPSDPDSAEGGSGPIDDGSSSADAGGTQPVVTPMPDNTVGTPSQTSPACGFGLARTRSPFVALSLLLGLGLVLRRARRRQL